MNILDRIVKQKQAEVAERKAARPLSALRDQPVAPPRDFAAALARPGLSVIAELKRRSPSRGLLAESLDPALVARAYEAGGAAAMSVLTDREFFGGSESDLQAARGAVCLPVIRKDFTIDEYQVHEARSIGADAVLLIVRILEDALLCDLLAAATGAGLAALVETHTAEEVDRALAAGARIVGVNSRDLDTFEVRLDAALALRPRIGDAIAVAESGIQTAEDAARVRAAGFDAILVGESLVRSGDPAGKIAELLGG